MNGDFISEGGLLVTVGSYMYVGYQMWSLVNVWLLGMCMVDGSIAMVTC